MMVQDLCLCVYTVYSIKSTDPRTETRGAPNQVGSAVEKPFPIFIVWYNIILIRNEETTLLML